MRERAVVTLGVIGAMACAGGAWGVVAMESGCQLQGQCDLTIVYSPSLPPGETPIPGVAPQSFQDGAGVKTLGTGETVWESGDIDGTWMNFPGQRTYIITPTVLADGGGGGLVGPFVPEVVLVSADPNPYPAPSNFAPSSGNITEFSGLATGGGVNGFQVTNNTCSPYYLWMRMGFAGAADGGGGDSGVGDAGADAEADAGD